jgi:hypothetical protein
MFQTCWKISHLTAWRQLEVRRNAEFLMTVLSHIAKDVHSSLRATDIPWSWRELNRDFGQDQVALVAAVVELRFERKIRRFEQNGIVYFEIP